MSALLFIDTNIYLDFYRFSGSGTSLSMLKHFDGNLDRIITTTEVEMEYKKNRQNVILLSLHSIKKVDIGSIAVPDFLKESQLNLSLVQTRRQLINRVNKKIHNLRNRISKLIENPIRYDPVYKVLERLFRAREKCHLYRTTDRELRDNIYELAQKRFTLGYPPKKGRDLSINDAINWEWIVYCAQNCSSDIVIVSRDSDYGIVSDKDAILNDWLRQEFKERVRGKRSIILTNRLAEGFKRASIQVTQQEEEEEQKYIKVSRQAAVDASWGSIYTNAAELNAAFSKLRDSFSNADMLKIAASTNFSDILFNTSASISTDTTSEEKTKTAQESLQEEKENDTT